MSYKILFLSYDGLTEALGQSQVLAYMKGVSGPSFQITIFSFDKPDLYEKYGDDIKKQCASANIKWYSLPYQNKPVAIATTLMLSKAWKLLKVLQETESFDLVHGRGGIISVLAKRMKKRYGTKFLFDMRGWWADEKLESGNWPFIIRNIAYHYFKYQERMLFLESDYIVSLTETGKKEIIKNKWKEAQKIGTVPTCTNLNIFKLGEEEEINAVKTKLGFPSGSKVLIYSGALGGNYPIDALFLFIETFLALNTNHYCLILSKDNVQINLPERTVLKSVPYTEVGKFLSIGDIGFIYYKPAFSNIGRFPTKLGEYWACGLLACSPAGIGDLEMVFDRFPNSGICIQKWEQNHIREALLKLIEAPVDKEVLRKAALNFFSVEKGIEFYKQVYSVLLKS